MHEIMGRLYTLVGEAMIEFHDDQATLATFLVAMRQLAIDNLKAMNVPDEVVEEMAKCFDYSPENIYRMVNHSGIEP